MFPALIAAAATIGASVIGSKATSKAGKQAADSSLQVANLNNSLAREFQTTNQANLAPWMSSGQRATATLDSMLYGGPVGGYQPNALLPPQQPAPAGFSYSAETPYMEPSFGSAAGYRDAYPGAPLSSYSTGQFGSAVPDLAASAGGGAIPAQTINTNALTGWDQFRNSSGYNFRLNEGIRALDHSAASRGMLDSGATRRAAITFGQNLASDEHGRYMSLLQGQQGTGMSAASAVAGVGQNALAHMTTNNATAGDARANALLLAGRANADMWGGIAGAIGTAAGQFQGFGSSYKKG